MSLTAPPSMEDLWENIHSMNGSGATGPYGFNGYFYGFCWEIIKSDLYAAILEFFVGFEMPRSWTCTSIVPIPKVSNPKKFTQFCPISLCNFSNKIITKILSTRLARILPKLISPEQSGFVLGRLIHDNILLAQELMQSINKKVRGANVAVKLDMQKAYDRVNWFALIKVMRRIGFYETWIDLIWRVISNCWFSVLINGRSCSFFKSIRGLCQGDPISTSFFIIVAEVMSGGLCQLHLQHSYLQYITSRGAKVISHLAYVDDVLIFCNGSTRHLRKHMEFFRQYRNFSRQEVNILKSCFVTGQDSRIEAINSVLGFTRKSQPVMYLKCPIYKERKTRTFYAHFRENAA